MSEEFRHGDSGDGFCKLADEVTALLVAQGLQEGCGRAGGRAIRIADELTDGRRDGRGDDDAAGG